MATTTTNDCGQKINNNQLKWEQVNEMPSATSMFPRFVRSQEWRDVFLRSDLPRGDLLHDDDNDPAYAVDCNDRSSVDV